MEKFLKKLWKKILRWLDIEQEEPFDYSRLQWKYGGCNGSAAKEDTSDGGYKLVSGSVSNKAITFNGQGGMWGYTHDKAYARNCIFFEESGEWYGGFWEWGSVDRVRREFDNIHDGYKGWDGARFDRAKKVLFFVMNKSGSKRSNLLFLDK